MTQLEINKAFAEGKINYYYDGIPDEIEQMSLDELNEAIEAEKKKLRDLHKK